MPLHITPSMVENALDHLWDYGVLGSHPLGNALAGGRRSARDQRGHMGRGQALSERLLAAMEQLKVSHDHAESSRERRYYAILGGCFVGRRTNREVAEELSISERTFYRERSRALEVLTRILQEGTNRSAS